MTVNFHYKSNNKVEDDLVMSALHDQNCFWKVIVENSTYNQYVSRGHVSINFQNSSTDQPFRRVSKRVMMRHQRARENFPESFSAGAVEFLREDEGRMITTYKQMGETPFMAMKRALREHNIPSNISSCYHGRLDPLAQGLMTVLVGSQLVKSRFMLPNKPKTYRFQAILGISTDSFDPMGKLMEVWEHVSKAQVDSCVSGLLARNGKTFMQAYPAVSGKLYKSKPLWYYHKEGISVPKISAERTVHEIRLLSQPVSITLLEYLKEILPELRKITPEIGDFDTKTIIKEWMKLDRCITLTKVCLEATVSQGTFIRSLVNDSCGSVPAHAWKITRI